jgi:hypothetical protein
MKLDNHTPYVVKVITRYLLFYYYAPIWVGFQQPRLVSFFLL